MLDTFGVPVAFVIVATLALWVIIGSKGWWWIKMGVATLTIFFSISLWYSLESLEGWPTDQPMPNRFEIKWIVVEEPNIKTGDEGQILIWAKDLEPLLREKSDIPLLHNKDQSDEPRLHRLPYTRELHQQAVQIQKKIAAGGRFFGEMRGKGKGKGKGQGRGKGKEGVNDGGSLSNEQDPIFHELPPPYFPQKVRD